VNENSLNIDAIRALVRTTVLIEQHCTNLQIKNRLMQLQLQANRSLIQQTLNVEVDEVS